MFLRIESSSAIPVYRQIVDQIKYQIAGGTLKPGDRLPSIRELAVQLLVNQNTILKAYDILAQEGILGRRKGDGTYVEHSLPSLKKSERLKQVSALLGQAAAQASHFQLSAEELHALLDQELKRLTRKDEPHD